MRLKATDKAWAAGILDGEGSIYIAHSFIKDKRYGRMYEQYALHVKVSNTDYAMLDKLADLFGGALFKASMKRKRADGYQRRQVWTWELAARKGERALRAMMPYLVTKRAEAEVALEFRGLGYGQQSRQGDKYRLQLIGMRQAS